MFPTFRIVIILYFCLILAVLKNADLTKTSSKKVRLQLEQKLKCDLTERKKEIDGLVMDYVNSQIKEDESDEASDAEEEVSEEETPKRAAKKTAPKKRKAASSDEQSESGDASEDEYKPQKGAKKAKKGRKRGGSSDSGSDDDWKKPKKAPRKAGAGKGKGTGFTRPYTLSPELAGIMGVDSCPRHEVVKKVWSIIKERNLYDPKNKQFAICDSELSKVIGVKRFRTFGMLKYLKPHFIN